MIVVNLFGAPGAGKSTGAAYIFAKLKMKGINAELVTEFAKDKVWDGAIEPFKNQAYIFGEQYYRMSRCLNKVDVIVTDSPLLLSLLYNESVELGDAFEETVWNAYSSYDNINYFVNRTKTYNPVGRIHSVEQSNQIANELHQLLDASELPYKDINGNMSDYDKVVEEIVKKIHQIKDNRIEYEANMHDFIEQLIWENIDFEKYTTDLETLAGVPLVDNIATLLAKKFYEITHEN